MKTTMMTLAALVVLVLVRQTIITPVTNADVLTFREGASSYVGTQDTWLQKDPPDAAHGSEQSFFWDIADNDPTNINLSLLRFDNITGAGSGQIPFGSAISSATLSLSVLDGGSGVRIHRMLATWSESDTWNSLNGGVSTDDVEAVATPDDLKGMQDNNENIPQGLLTLDVTNSLKAWVGDGQAQTTNFGWALLPLTPGGINGVGVRSSEFGTIASRPMLEVVFIPEPSTLTLAACALLGLAYARRRTWTAPVCPVERKGKLMTASREWLVRLGLFFDGRQRPDCRSYKCRSCELD